MFYMRKALLSTLVILKTVLSIKFDYTAGKHEFICFHEDVQKETRFQVVIKSEKPTYSLQIFEQENSIYEDDRADAYVKEYSAYSKINGQLMICLANKDFQEYTIYQIEFYQGIHLDSFTALEDSDSFTQLGEIMAQTFEMQKFVKMAYNMNVKTLIQRNEIISSMGAIMTIATLISLTILILSRTLLISKLKRLLRQKKMI